MLEKQMLYILERFLAVEKEQQSFTFIDLFGEDEIPQEKITKLVKTIFSYKIYTTEYGQTVYFMLFDLVKIDKDFIFIEKSRGIKSDAFKSALNSVRDSNFNELNRW